MGEVFVFALTASLNPTLLAATTVMLLLDSPSKLMLGYLLGAYLTSITLGLVIVFSLSNSSTANTTQHTLSPAADLVLGGLLLTVAFVVSTGRLSRRASGARHARRRSRTRDPRAGSES